MIAIDTTSPAAFAGIGVEVRMAVYTYYLHETSDRAPAFEIALFDALDPALDYGRALLKARTRYAAVEITRDDATIARLTREAIACGIKAASPAPDPRSS